MGRYIKNFRFEKGAYAVGLPIGTSTIGPDHPVDGQMRFNSDTSQFEVFHSSAWHVPATAGRVNIIKDSLVGDGTTTDFNMTVSSVTYYAGHEAEVLVYISGVFQNPGVAYTFGPTFGPLISFTSPPNPGMPIVILHNFNSTLV